MGMSVVGILLMVGLVFVVIVSVVLLVMLVGLASKNFPLLIWLAVPLVIFAVMVPIFYRMTAIRETSKAKSIGAFSTQDARPRLSAEATNRVPVAAKTEEQPLAWGDVVKGKPNVYPSVAECGKQMARLLAKDLDDEGQVDYYIEFVFDHPVSLQEDFGAGFIHEINGLLANKPLVTFTSKSPKRGWPKLDRIKSEETNDLGVTHVVVECEHEITLSDPNEYDLDFKKGTIYCSWKKDNGKQNNSASFEYNTKPWLSDAKQFQTKHSRYKWLVGKSQRLAKSPEDAAADAFSNVNAQLSLSSNEWSFSRFFRNQEMMERNVVDRFVPKISMPYGDVWREAVLICLDPPTGINGLEALPKPNDLANNVASSSSGVQSRYNNPSQNRVARIHRAPISPESALAMLAGIVVLIGLGSNLLTQGYYLHQIKTTVILAVGLIVCVLSGIVMIFVVGSP